MQDIHSLPDSLREQIQDAASSILQPTTVNVQPAGDPVQKILAEIAHQSPELFVALIIAKLGYCGIETIETEEKKGLEVIETGFSKDTYRELKPVHKTKTITRQVRLLTERSKGLRERP